MLIDRGRQCHPFRPQQRGILRHQPLRRNNDVVILCADDRGDATR